MIFLFFFFKQKTAYEITTRLVGSEMCIRDSACTALWLSSFTHPLLTMPDGQCGFVTVFMIGHSNRPQGHSFCFTICIFPDRREPREKKPT